VLDGSATVPFIARYRKELTGALDDAQLRTLEERLTYICLNLADPAGKCQSVLSDKIKRERQRPITAAPVNPLSPPNREVTICAR
jgi:transcriptional accessory protein Tex/SPT6